MTDRRPATVTGVLSSASAAAYDRFLPHVVNSDRGDGWVTGHEVLARPDHLLRLAATAGPNRFRSTDRQLVLMQVVREAVAALTSAAVHTWCCQRRLLDLATANVALRDGDIAVVAGLRKPALAVLPGDPLAGRTGVETIDETVMLDRLVNQTLGQPLPPGAMPSGPPEQVAATTTVIAALRQLVRCGDRHLWGSVALAAGNALTRASHLVGERARADRRAVLSARPDLARTIELISTDDDRGDPLTFTLRRTCCLLYKLPDGPQCATCSLVDHDCRVASLGQWHRADRQRSRHDPT